jgi:hypothetical protein
VPGEARHGSVEGILSPAFNRRESSLRIHARTKWALSREDRIAQRDSRSYRARLPIDVAQQLSGIFDWVQSKIDGDRASPDFGMNHQ